MAIGKDKTTSRVEKMLFWIIRFEIICLKISLWLGVISALTDFTNICFQRYEIPPNAFGHSTSSQTFGTTATVTLRADGNYTPIVSTGGTSAAPSAPANYGKWLRSNLRLAHGQQLRAEVSGQISLCRAYLPKYHLQVANVGSGHSGSNYVTNTSGDKIPIPRLEEGGYVTMIMDPSTVKGWRNLTEVYRHDKLSVIVDDNISPGQTVTAAQTMPTAATCNTLSTASDRDSCNAALATISTRSCTQSDAAVRALCQQRNARLATLTDAQCATPTADIRDLCVIRASARTSAAQAQTVSLSNVSVRESVGNTTVTGNCAENRTTYSPVCGRYSLWNGTTGRYISNCVCAAHAHYCDDYRPCNGWSVFGACLSLAPPNTHWRSCSRPTYSIPPRPYLDNSSRTQARFTNTNMMQNVPSTGSCHTSGNGCSGWTSYRNKFWFSATDVSGLQQKFNTSIHPGSSTAPGSGYTWSSIIGAGTDIYADADSSRKIYSQQYSGNTAYFQLRLHGVDFSGISPTGGYVVKLKQTKCFREDGSVATDSYTNRGLVEYLVLPPGDNPNTTPSLAASPSSLSGSVSNITASTGGYIWFRVKNNPADYIDSSGTYRISLGTTQTYNSFSVTILNPIFNYMRTRIQSIGEQIFQNTICYQQTDKSPCMNFFNYVRAMLILYITFLGFRFLMGSNIKHDELVKALLKVVIVAGLMNGSTYEFVARNILPLVRGFSDEILANMSGFSMLSSTNSISNPFGFADALLTKMFMNPSFIFQLLTILTMHITGIFYFIVVVVAVVIFITAMFQAMAVYVMALLATTLLVGLSPMFIVFMLFDKTYFLFQNWAKFLFKYMLEPVIVMAGIIILTQLFTIYLDQVLVNSLCWKCALPFKIPFSSLLPFPGLQNVPIFCLYWFSPWGLSPYSDPMGIDIAMIIGLVIVSYTAYGWVNFSENIAINLVGSEGGPSSISLGQAFASNVAATQLKKYGLDNQSMKEARDRLSKGLKASRDAKADHRGKGLGGGPGDGGAGGGSGGGTGDAGGRDGGIGAGSSTPKMGGAGARPDSGDSPQAPQAGGGSPQTPQTPQTGSDPASSSPRPSAPAPAASGPDSDAAPAAPAAPTDPTAAPADGGDPAKPGGDSPPPESAEAKQAREAAEQAEKAKAEAEAKAAEEKAKAEAEKEAARQAEMDGRRLAQQQADRAAAASGTPTGDAGAAPDAPTSGGVSGPGGADADSADGLVGPEIGASNPAEIAEQAKDLGVDPEKLKVLEQMNPEDLKGMKDGVLAEKLGLGEDFREGRRLDEIKDFMERVKQSGSGTGAGR